jgi:hypothetical protein
MIHPLRHPRREHLLSKAALAVDLFLWLWCLPVLLRIYAVPELLARLSERAKTVQNPVLDFERVTSVVAFVCNLRPFRSRLFPKVCLRQSLALYRTLVSIGYPAEVHFGVRKDQSELTGHSWVTVDGTPVGDTTDSATFKVIYSHGSPRTSEATGKFNNG